VLPEGTLGELVLTTLTREAQPLIRYRTRDLTSLLPGTARSVRRLSRIGGRSDDMLIVRGVNVFPTQIEEIILADARLSPNYLLELRREHRLDALTVVVERRAGHEGASESEIAAGLVARIKDLVGVTVAVRLTGAGTLEPSTGKARRLVDLRTHG
jgi:phenylacetate-CoA ligase